MGLSTHIAKSLSKCLKNYNIKNVTNSIEESSHFVKVLFIFIFLITYLNLNMAFLKLVLLLDGNVESNPGPNYSIRKVVQGSFHQGDIYNVW